MSNRLEHGPHRRPRRQIVRNTRRATPLVAAAAITVCMFVLGWLTH
jgi:hypothetical protein